MGKREAPAQVARKMLSSRAVFAAIVREFYRQIDEKDAQIAALVSRVGYLSVKESTETTETGQESTEPANHTNIPDAA
jgi:hypothetical protein